MKILKIRIVILYTILLILPVNIMANPPHIFTAGAVISSSEINANFADVYSKLSNGTILELSTNATQACETYTSNRNHMIFDVKVRDDGGYDTGTGYYTFPKTDYYNISTKISSSVGKYSFSYKINTGAWSYINHGGTAITIKVNQNDTIKFGYLCDNSKGDTNATIDASQTFITIIPL